MSAQKYQAYWNYLILVTERPLKMTANLNNRKFSSVANTDNGDVGSQTVFYYRQQGELVWAEYSGGSIRRGNLIALWIAENVLEMHYQHISTDNEFKTGRCLSRPEVLLDGRLRMHEEWQWTSGDGSSGTSVIEEMKS